MCAKGMTNEFCIYAVCCSVLQRVAACCSEICIFDLQRGGQMGVIYMQYVAVCCSVLQCVAVCCSVLQ